MISLEKWSDGGGFTLRDGDAAFQMFDSEARQARDELLKALPLDFHAITVMAEDAGLRVVQKGVTDGMMKAHQEALDYVDALGKMNATGNTLWISSSRKEMLNIEDVRVGDICERSDLSDYSTNDRWLYILSALPASDEGNWLRIFDPKKQYPFGTFSMGATVSGDEAGIFRPKTDAEKLTKQLHPVIAALSPEAQMLYVKKLLDLDWWVEDELDLETPVKYAKRLRDMFIAGLTSNEETAE